VFSGKINKVVNKQVPNEKHVFHLECGKIVIIEFQIVVGGYVVLVVSEQGVPQTHVKVVERVVVVYVVVVQGPYEFEGYEPVDEDQ
jgi:hypothetical protein